MKRMLALVLCLAMLTDVVGAGYKPAEGYSTTGVICWLLQQACREGFKIRKSNIGDQTINVHTLNENEIVLIRGVRTEWVSVAEFNDVHFPDMGVYIKQLLIDRVLNKDDRSRSISRGI